MKSITVTEVPANVQLIDVREPDEFAEVHARGAKNVPLSQLPDLTGEINDDQEIYVICRSGGRSAQAAQYLERYFDRDDIVNVEGGTIAWVEAELPTG